MGYSWDREEDLTARIGSLDLAAALGRLLVVPSLALSVPFSLSISDVTARYPFDRLEGVVGQGSWRYESCTVDMGGIVSGSVSGIGSGSGSEIEGLGAR